MSSRFPGSNDPFFNFFDNIHKEVQEMNNLFTDPFFRTGWGQNPRRPAPPQQQQIKDNNNGEVTKKSDNSERRVSPFFGSFFDDSFSSLFIKPPVDIHEYEKGYGLQVSVPGAAKENIIIDFNKDTNELSVNGEIPETVNEKKEGDKVVYSERSVGKFSRSLKLPDNVDGEKIKASFENGVLHLEVPKVEKKAQKNVLHRIQIGDTSAANSSTSPKKD